MITTNFTPGPSQLYFTVQDHVKQAFRDGIPSLSHRSKQFETIYQNASDGVKQLLNVPDNYSVLFTSSATEIWERLAQNLIEKKSAHLVNGAFSKKFAEIVQQLNRQTELHLAADGKGFENITISDDAELISITQNETSTGVSIPTDFINSFRESYKNAIIAVDAVSSLPYPKFDYNKIDTVYFSVQKAFGLPAGLGVWLINERCLERAEHIQQSGKSIGSYHSIPSLVSMAKKNQTPETPNVLGIYLFSRILQDLQRRGIETIRRETDYKAAILYQTLSTHSIIKPFVEDKRFRSQSVIVADTGIHTASVTKFLESRGLSPGEGYGAGRTSQLRFANFPAHSKEQYELLVDTLAEFKV